MNETALASRVSHKLMGGALAVLGLVGPPMKHVVRSRSLRDFVHRQRWKMAISRGERLVPEAALKDKLREALAWLGARGELDRPSDYLEFGVFNGTSFLCMHEVSADMGARSMRLFGFDSFEGLPGESAEDGWQPGMFSIDYNYAHRWLTRRGVDWRRAALVKGWFRATLTPLFARQNRIEYVSVVMIDCDAYSSAKEALAFCMPLLARHAVLIFDDWNSLGLASRNSGEKRALDEYLAVHDGYALQDFGNYNSNSQVFKVTRTP